MQEKQAGMERLRPEVEEAVLRGSFPSRGCPSANLTLPPGLHYGAANSTEPHHRVLSYEDATLWPLATINCLIVVFVFSKGKPFRKPIYTNCEHPLFAPPSGTGSL